MKQKGAAAGGWPDTMSGGGRAQLSVMEEKAAARHHQRPPKPPQKMEILINGPNFISLLMGILRLASNFISDHERTLLYIYMYDQYIKSMVCCYRRILLPLFCHIPMAFS